MEITSIADQVKKELVSMVFGEENKDPEESLRLFVNAKLRKGMPDDKIVYKHGVTRYPEVNHFTGGVAFYGNLEVLKLSLSDKVVNAVREKYGISSDSTEDIGLYHGPPSLIVKPSGSGISPPFSYWFQDLSEGEKYTALLPLTQHSEEESSGGLEILKGSEIYFDLLNRWFDFSKHCKAKDILYLEAKWFTVTDARKLIAQYTMLYNYYNRGIKPEGEISIPAKVRDFFMKNKIEVPQNVVDLKWVPLETKAGEPIIFSSKQILRTQSARDPNARIYVQIPFEPKPRNWDKSLHKSSLQRSYESGRFGNWIKPGLRLYLRENSTESTWRDKYETKEEKDARDEFIRSNSKLLGL